MHASALKNAEFFFKTYVTAADPLTVVDIGAQDVNGSLRQVCPPHLKYVGVDFVAGRGVDIVLTDPYSLPFDSDSVDVVVSSSCLEHSELFWLAFLEMLRILRPTGLLYLNVPANGNFHRYPVDCWRFYPDAGAALVTWARRNGMNPALLESYTARQRAEPWNDYVAVYVEDAAQASRYPKRITSVLKDFSNGRVLGSDEILHHSKTTEDQSNLSYRLKRWRWRMKQALGAGA